MQGEAAASVQRGVGGWGGDPKIYRNISIILESCWTLFTIKSLVMFFTNNLDNLTARVINKHERKMKNKSCIYHKKQVWDLAVSSCFPR